MGEPRAAGAPGRPKAVIAEELRIQTAQVARIDGAVSGTPFLIALVPGYLAYLWQEGVMERRIAALYGSDPRSLETSANILVLRGVHPTPMRPRRPSAEVRDAPLPEKPTTRRPLRVWVRSIYAVLIFGGFLSAPTAEEDKGGPWRMKAAVGLVVGLGIWAITWILPVSFMIAMAWGCESHARGLGHRTMTFYGGEGAIAEAADATGDEGHGRTRRDIAARRAPRALDRRPDRVHRLRRPRPPDHRHQLARRPRRPRRRITRHRHDGRRPPPLTPVDRLPPAACSGLFTEAPPPAGCQDRPLWNLAQPGGGVL